MVRSNLHICRSVHRLAAAGREAKKNTKTSQKPRLLRSPNFSETKAKLLRSGGSRLLRSRNQTSEKVRSNFKTEPMRRQNATSQKLLKFQFRPTISAKTKLLRSENRTSQKSKKSTSQKSKTDFSEVQAATSQKSDRRTSQKSDKRNSQKSPMQPRVSAGPGGAAG